MTFKGIDRYEAIGDDAAHPGHRVVTGSIFDRDFTVTVSGTTLTVAFGDDHLPAGERARLQQLLHQRSHALADDRHRHRRRRGHRERSGRTTATRS